VIDLMCMVGMKGRVVRMAAMTHCEDQTRNICGRDQSEGSLRSRRDSMLAGG